MTMIRNIVLVCIIFLSVMPASAQTYKENSYWRLGPTYLISNSNQPVRSLCMDQANEVILDITNLNSFWMDQEWDLDIDEGEAIIEKIDNFVFMITPISKRISLAITVKVNDEIYFPKPRKEGLEYAKSIYDDKGNLIRSRIYWIKMSEHMNLPEGDFGRIDSKIMGLKNCN